jgi:hypothetical protein
MTGRTVFEYTDYTAWNNAVLRSGDTRRVLSKNGNNVIEVYRVRDNALVGYWDCECNAGEVYSQ